MHEQTITLSLLVKLASIARHTEEYLASPFDRVAIQGLLSDPEVIECLTELDTRSLLPLKR